MKEGSYTLQDGTAIATRHWGVESPRARLLIVHGLGEHCGRWSHVALFFNARDIDVHSYDLRGHGRSGGAKLDIETFDDHIDDLAEMVAHVDRGDLPLVVYGHSMGGLVATGYAVSDRPQPDLYVLSAPALGATVPVPLRVAVRVLARVAPTTRLPASIKAEHLSKNPAVGEAYFADPDVHLKGTARGGHAFLEAMDSLSEEIHKIDVPTLVVHGGDDVLVPTAVSAQLAAVPGITRKVFPVLRHEIHNEDERDEVLAYVGDWIDSNL